MTKHNFSLLRMFQVLVLSLALSVSLGVSWASTGVAQASQETKDNYQYLEYGATKSDALPQGRKANSSGRKVRKNNKDVELPTWQQAFKELTVSQDEQSSEVRATPATVATNVSAVGSPIERPSYQLDLAFEPYRPAGRMKLAGFDAYDLDSLGIRPMPSLGFRWLPFALESGSWISKPSALGVFASGAYTQQPIGLVSPTGEMFQGTNLSTLKWQAGGAWSMLTSSSSPWGGRLEGGIGEMRIVQASGSAFANHSASETFASLAIYGERRIWTRISAFIAYDHRIPIGSGADEIELSRSNFKVGISGGFN